MNDPNPPRLPQPIGIGLVACLLFLADPAQIAAQQIGADAIPFGESLAVSEDGLLEIRASGTFSGSSSEFGVAGGINPNAIDDADGLEPADEWLLLQFAEEGGLAGLDVVWTRAVVTIVGFIADPEASTGSYDAATGAWTVSQPWTGGNIVSYDFAHAAASAGQTLTLTALDPNQAGPQIAVVRVRYQAIDSDPPDAALLADGSVRLQVIDHFGASMLWTIDPTENWPVELKEELAQKLISQAGGIGLSNLRFDFGGGNRGTGTATGEPWSWRFPEPMKDGAEAAFDWTRREGQQWFLRRGRDMGLTKFTLASISPPWWLTKNGLTYCSPNSGTTNIELAQMDAYADYLIDVLLHFRDQEGITFAHVSPVNEPEWDWESGSQEGNRATAADIRAMVTPLHAKLVEHGLDQTTPILAGEHATVNPALDDEYHRQFNGDIWRGSSNNALGKYREYIKDLHAHPDVFGKIDPVVSYHSYFTDSVNALSTPLRSLFAANAADHGLDVMQTEYCILGSYGPGRDLQMDPARHVFRTIHKDLTDARATAWNWWLALSPHDYKDGLVYTDFNYVGKPNPKLFDSKILWILGNFSKFIRPGFQQIGSGDHGDLGGLMASTWQSPDGRELVIVAGNFSDAPIDVSLPEEAPGASGTILEWEPWVTDRGRNLRRETPVKDRFILTPQSVTTFVGRTSDSPYRLRARLAPASPAVAPGQSTTLNVHATYEDGVFTLPAIHPSAELIFQPVSQEPIGALRAGRYFIRDRADHSSLALAMPTAVEAGLTFETSSNPAQPWDVLPQEDGSLILTHTVSGWAVSIQPGGAVAGLGAADPIIAWPVELDADFTWTDNVGEGSAIIAQPLVTSWYQATARVGNDLATSRVRLRVGEAPPTLSRLPELVISRPGEPVTLRVLPRDPARPWTFRIAPADRSEVLAVVPGPAPTVNMVPPKGQVAENWHFVDASRGQTWLTLEPGRRCRIRSADGSSYLTPSGEGVESNTPVIVASSPTPASIWIVDAVENSRFRIRHEQSGLVLNISGGTGLPILWPDSETGNARFHFDALDEDPLGLTWSHELGHEIEQTVAPNRTTTYTVHGSRGGQTFTAHTTVLVQQTYAEWSEQWLGEETVGAASGDKDGDGVSDLMEYARGTNPLRSYAEIEWPAIRPIEGGLSFAWAKNPEALGTWEVQISPDLRLWNSSNPAIQILEQTARIYRVGVAFDDLQNYFLRLRFTPAGG